MEGKSQDSSSVESRGGGCDERVRDGLEGAKRCHSEARYPTTARDCVVVVVVDENDTLSSETKMG